MPGENSGRILVFIREKGEGGRGRGRGRGRERKSRESREKERDDGQGRRVEAENDGGEVSIVPPRPRGLGALPYAPLPPVLPLPSRHRPPSVFRLARSLSPIIIIFYHNICFSHILFYVNGRSLPLPALSVPRRLPSPSAGPLVDLIPPRTAVASYAWPRGTFSILSRI